MYVSNAVFAEWLDSTCKNPSVDIKCYTYPTLHDLLVDLRGLHYINMQQKSDSKKLLLMVSQW